MREPEGGRITNFDPQPHRIRSLVQHDRLVASNQTLKIAAEDVGDWNPARPGRSQIEIDARYPVTNWVAVIPVDDQWDSYTTGGCALARRGTRVGHSGRLKGVLA